MLEEVSEGVDDMVDRTRAIAHLDMDAFFAAVEVLENPDLKGKPVLVGGRPEERGVVAAASYPARVFGVHSAMPMARALALCPDAIVLPPRLQLYRDFSRRVMELARDVTPLIEQVSIDEAFLDLTDRVIAWQEAVSAARRLQKRIAEEIGLSASLGVATNKQVAKVASDRQKPGGLTVVPPGEEAAFLAPLSVRVLWGIGPVTAEGLAEMGISTVGELATLPIDVLRARFGRHGVAMARRAQGIDQQPVVTKREPKSVSRERTFRRDVADGNILREQLWRLSQGVARRLREKGKTASTIAIKLRYADFVTISRQMTLDVPTDDEQVIYRATAALLRQSWEHGRSVRLLGVAGRNLSSPAGQLPLPIEAII